MAAAACAKALIDSRNALVQQLDCMVASILLAGTFFQREPTMEDVDEFQAAANELAKVAAKIERAMKIK